MATLVRKAGFTSLQNRYQTRGAFNLSDGTAVVVVHDRNFATSYDVTYGDRSSSEKIYVYSSTDRINWTLRTTIVAPLSGGRITANVSLNNTIGILNITALGVRYIPVPSSTWVAGATETPRADLVAPNAENHWDLSFTDGNVPVVTSLRTTNTGSNRLQLMGYVKRTVDSVWVTTTLVNNLETTLTPATKYMDVALAALEGGTAAARNIAVACGSGTGTTDRGIKVYTAVLDEVTTGAFTSVTVRGTPIAVGGVPGSVAATSARTLMMFQSGTNEYTLGYQHFLGTKTIGVTRATFNGTTWTQTIPVVSSVATTSVTQYKFAMTYSDGRIAFHWVDTYGHAAVRLARVVNNNFVFSGSKWFNNRLNNTLGGPVSNGGPHTQYHNHDTTYLWPRNGTVNRQEYLHHYVAPPKAPVIVAPAPGGTVTTSTPPLRSLIDLDIQYPQSDVRVKYEFATNSTFTTNYTSYEEGQVTDTLWKAVNNTHLAGASVLAVDVLPAAFELNQGLWYVRVSVVTQFGVVGPASVSSTFTVSHPPAAGELTPSGGFQTYDGSLDVAWKFTDPFSLDSQTAFQVVVTDTVTGLTVHDSGKVVSTAKTYAAPVTTAVKDVPLEWTVRLWDSDDVAGAYAPSAAVTIVDIPSVAITAPTSGAVLTTAVPTVSATVTVGGSRTIKKWRIRFLQAGVERASSGWVGVNIVSGSVVTYSPPIEVLQNLSSYTIEATVEDSYGIRSTATTIPVTTSWTVPATASSVLVNITPYNTEGQGWVAVTWTDASMDVDFSRYIVYRKDDLLDPLTLQLLDSTGWVEIGEATDDTLSTYLFKDWTVPSGHQISYKVEQQVSRFGDLVTSNTAVATVVSPVADSYWLIEPDDDNAFRLGSVTEDSYTDEYEETDYVVIGRGRHFEQGERVGYSGSLSAQIRNYNGISARQHKQRLDTLKKENRRLYIRTPFGDMFKVAVSSMQISRLSGVGLSEFVDMTIPYMEVGE